MPRLTRQPALLALLGKAGGGLVLALLVLLWLGAGPAFARAPLVYCIGAGQEREIQNMLLPFRLGLEVADGFILEQVLIDSERIIVRLVRGEEESRLLLLPPEQTPRRRMLRFTARYEGDPAGMDAAQLVAARALNAAFDPWARCDRSLTPTPAISEEIERRQRQPQTGVLLVLASAGVLLLGLSALFHRRQRILSGHIALMLAACLFGLFLAEGLLRLTLSSWTRPIQFRDGCYPSNPRGSFTPMPVFGHPGLVAYCIGGGTLAWAECETPLEEPAPLRLVALGDSFTEATGVAFADTWPKLLESRLNASGEFAQSQVVNCARSGANIDAIVARYRELVDRHNPQVVVYGFVLNDVAVPLGVDRRTMADINFQINHPEQERAELVHPVIERLREQSAVARLLAERLGTRHVARKTEAGYRAMYAEPSSPQLETALELIAAMAEDSRAKGRHFLVMIWPLIYRLDAYPFAQAHELLGRELTRRGVPVLDLLPAMRRHKAEDLWVHPSDYHPNEIAQALAAEVLHEALRRLGWLAEIDGVSTRTTDAKGSE